MADRPIIFSAPMVRALLAGRKTQAQRICKADVPTMPALNNVVHRPPKHERPYLDSYCGAQKSAANPRGMSEIWCWWTRDDRCGPQFKIPFVPGDRLWVRESWQLHSLATDVCTVAYAASINASWTEAHEQFPDHYAQGRSPKPFQAGWRPSIHMPRWASRLTLEVTDVRVQRLQDISRDDVLAEGIVERQGLPIADVHAGWHEPFADLWCSLHGADAWSANPWVAALTFTVTHTNIDAQATAAARLLAEEPVRCG